MTNKETAVANYGDKLFIKVSLLKNEAKDYYFSLPVYTVKEICLMVVEELLLASRESPEQNNFYQEVKQYIIQL